jgi:hypothetical protein
LNTRIIFCLILLLAALVLWPPGSLAQDFPRVCLEDSGNLTRNCKFDNGLDSWQTFTEDGSASISVLQGGGECHAPQCPAAYIVTESHFVGGIYQQVPAVPGNTYYANINWLVFDSLVNDASVNNAVGGIGRRVGIDPFGGTDSTSSTVVWSNDNWRSDCKTCLVEFVTATAQADTLTVFIRIEDTWRVRAGQKGYPVPPTKDQFWLDEVGLKQVSGDAAPAIQALEVLPTDPPTAETTPADTPVIEATPTNTPASEATPTPTATPTETGSTPEEIQPVSPLSPPDESAVAAVVAAPPTLTPTMTRTPTLTPSPRPTREPTSTRRPQVEPAAASMLPGGILGVAGTTVCAGGLILAVMIVVISGLAWLYRLGWGTTDDDTSTDDDFTDDDSVVIEIIED